MSKTPVRRVEKIYASAHHHYYVMDKTNKSLLTRGNPNEREIGLSYGLAGFDFETDKLVECDTREEAIEHLRRVKKQLKTAKFDKKHYQNLVVVRGWVTVEVETK